MKNYEELTKDLLARRDCYVAAQKQKRITAVTSLCCVCILALLGFGFWKGGFFRPVTGGQTISGNILYTPTTPTPTTTIGNATIPTKNAPIQISWVVNQVKGFVGGARLNYETSMYYSETKNIAEMAQHFGRDFSTLTDVMPDGFQFAGNYERKFYYENNGTLVCDDCHFYYTKGEQEIAIHASKIGVPYDYLYRLDNLIPSNINGVEMIVGEFHSNNVSPKTDLVFADFSHKGIQYRVTVKNVPFDGSKDAPSWLVDILAELIK